jgi:hypothetical protein
VGPDGEVLLQPGDVIELVHVGPDQPEVRLSRFAPVEDGLALAVPPGSTVVRIEVPPDAPSVADLPGLAERYPYRVLSTTARPLTDCP